MPHAFFAGHRENKLKLTGKLFPCWLACKFQKVFYRSTCGVAKRSVNNAYYNTNLPGKNSGKTIMGRNGGNRLF